MNRPPLAWDFADLHGLACHSLPIRRTTSADLRRFRGSGHEKARLAFPGRASESPRPCRGRQEGKGKWPIISREMKGQQQCRIVYRIGKSLNICLVDFMHVRPHGTASLCSEPHISSSKSRGLHH